MWVSGTHTQECALNVEIQLNGVNEREFGISVIAFRVITFGYYLWFFHLTQKFQISNKY